MSSLFYYVKDFITDFNKNKEEAFRGLKFKRDQKIIEYLVSTSEKLEEKGLFDNEIIVGNKNSENTIITLTNPYCGHCKRALENYIKTLDSNKNVKLVFRFNTSLEDKKNALTKLIVRLAELYFEKGQEVFLKSYAEWFEHKNVSKWYANYGAPKFTEQVINILENHNKWCKNNEVHYTPATILNGIFYPNKLEYKDLPMVADTLLTLKNTERVQTETLL